MRISPPRRGALLGAMAAALVLAGCGVGAAPSAVQLLVTRDFGARVVRSTGALQSHESKTVLGLLMRHDAVRTAPAAHSVQSIDGFSAGLQDGEPVSWLYYVNGVLAPKGAAVTSVRGGDHIWWDLHDASRAKSPPAVVGSFPEPFLNGIEGKRLPVRIECSSASGYACRTVISRLRALRVPAAVAAIGSGAAPETLRVMVAPWSQLEASIAQSLERSPSVSGVYARFSARGSQLTLLNEDGEAAQSLSASAGLIAATRQPEEAPVWLITGTDGAGVDRAADALDQATLQHRFAVALGPAGAVALPAPGSGTL